LPTRSSDVLDAAEVALDAVLEGKLDKAAAVMASELDVGQARAQNLTPDRRSAIATGARAELCRRSLFHFFKFGWHVLEPETPLELSWHHKLICDYIQAMLEDWIACKRGSMKYPRVQNAIFNLPPGTTKSRIISVYAVAWMWLRYPSWTVLCLSGNPDVAERDAMLCRELVTSDWYRSLGVTWVIRDDVDAKKKYRNSMGGERTSRGMMSKIVGNRTDAWLIDDPNDMYEVLSDSIRNGVNSKFNGQIFNRVNDPRISLRICMQQRGHVQDLTGFWEGKGDVVKVNIPMEFDPARVSKTPFGFVDPRTRKGELLHPTRFTEAFVASEKKRLGSFMYEAQYNGDPRNLDTGMFKRRNWRFFRWADTPISEMLRPPGCLQKAESPAVVLGYKSNGALDVDWMIITVDATFGSESDTASRVGLALTVGKHADRYVVADRSDVMTFPKTIDEIEKLYKEAKQRFPRNPLRVIVEKKANGAAVVQTLKKKFQGFVAVEPEGGKFARANAMLPGQESGNWYLLDDAEWLPELVEELALFGPGCDYDDRVDMLSQLHIFCETQLGALAKWEALAR